MRTRPRWRQWLGWEIAAAVVVVLIATTLLLARNLSTRPGEPVTSPSTATTSTGAPSTTPQPVLAVKIDNVAAARPQTGLGAADVM